jgi:hypothetical protein
MKVTARHKKLASLLGDGAAVGAAMIEAGYSKQAAAQGWAKVPKVVLGILPKKAKKLITLGREIGKDDRRAMVLGRLMENTTQGKDGGAMSAKILGSDRELNMWQPDSQTGLIVLNAPNWTEEQMKQMMTPPVDLDKPEDSAKES